MFNADKKMREFHDNEVSLSSKQRDGMRGRKDANTNRLNKHDFTAKGDPQPQGSYSMHTMVQEANDDYDIDIGLVFLKEDLKGSNGGELSSIDVRHKVRDALDDGSFNTKPQTLKNCVRVYYNDGPHIDIPIYRKLDTGILELASSEWKESNPKAVTEWFNKQVMDQSPDDKNGRQLRRVVKLLKAIKNSSKSCKENMPSGFVISALVVECYTSHDRDDRSLYLTMDSIRRRLNINLEVDHPILSEKLTKGLDDIKTKFLREKLSTVIDCLSDLLDGDCTEEKADKCWNKAFNHTFWDNDNKSSNIKKPIVIGIPKVIPAIKPYREF